MPVLRKHSLIFPHESSLKPFATQQSLLEIDLIIAEVTYPSTGQGIELGWASFLGVPITCLFKEGAKYSSSLDSISNSFFEYQDLELLDWVQILKV